MCELNLGCDRGVCNEGDCRDKRTYNMQSFYDMYLNNNILDK